MIIRDLCVRAAVLAALVPGLAAPATAQLTAVELVEDIEGDFIAVDSRGWLLVADDGLDIVVRVTPWGTRETILDATGDGQGAAGLNPGFLAWGQDGEAYVLCNVGGGQRNLFRVDADDSVHLLDVLPASFARLTKGAFTGAVYVQNRHAVSRIAPDGTLDVVVGPEDFQPPVDLGLAALEEDPDGRLFVTTSPGTPLEPSESLHVITPSGAINHIMTRDEIPDFARDESGTLFVATGTCEIGPFGTCSGFFFESLVLVTPAGVQPGWGFHPPSMTATRPGWIAYLQPTEIRELFVAACCSNNVVVDFADYPEPADDSIRMVIEDDAYYVSFRGSRNVVRYARPWVDLGGASASTSTQLTGNGFLRGGETVSLDLTGAPPSTLMLARFSLAPSPTPLFGGTFFGLSFFHQQIVGTDAAGSWTTSLTWPSPPPLDPGTSFVLQFIVQDPSSPDGLVLSNGLTAEVE